MIIVRAGFLTMLRFFTFIVLFRVRIFWWVAAIVVAWLIMGFTVDAVQTETCSELRETKAMLSDGVDAHFKERKTYSQEDLEDFAAVILILEDIDKKYLNRCVKYKLPKNISPKDKV